MEIGASLAEKFLRLYFQVEVEILQKNVALKSPSVILWFKFGLVSGKLLFFFVGVEQPM